jgi:hypothetical protein
VKVPQARSRFDAVIVRHRWRLLVLSRAHIHDAGRVLELRLTTGCVKSIGEQCRRPPAMKWYGEHA